jgi:hypothetical protein
MPGTDGPTPEARAWAAEGSLASIADAVNTWCREVGVRESPDVGLSNIREALDRIGFRCNQWKAQHDALQFRLRGLEK